MDAATEGGVQELGPHLIREPDEIPGRVSALRPGHWLQVDEDLVATGEASWTLLAVLENFEHTNRATGVNLIYCTPVAREHTAAFELECLLVNEERLSSLCVVWKRGRPLGYVRIPWAREPLWRQYGPFKVDSMERTRRMTFRKNDQLFVWVMEAFEDRRYVRFLVAFNKLSANKMKMATAAFFGHRSWTKSQRDDVAELSFTLLQMYGKWGAQGFREAWKRDPPSGFVETAAKVYEE